MDGIDIVKAVAEADLLQGDLFPDLAGQELLTIEKDRVANKHTGSTLAKRTLVCEMIMECVVLGMSKRQIVRRFGVGKHTLDGLIEIWEKEGKVAPLKERLSKTMGKVIEAGAEAVLEGIRDGIFPLTHLSVCIGIFSDKKALLDGGPTQITQVQGTKITAENLNAFLDSLPSAKTTPAALLTQSADSQSEDSLTKPL